MTTLHVLETGPLTTVQDQGRRRLTHLGVPESGALDPRALRLANRLVGNPERAAGLETTGGGLVLHADGPVVVAATGAPSPLRVDGVPRPLTAAVHVPAGGRIELGASSWGLRGYLAIRGGVVDREILGSSSTDLLSGLGAPLEAGEELRVGPAPADPVPAHDPLAWAAPPSSTSPLRVVLGPRHDWFTEEAVALLTATDWLVGSRSNRVGLRLEGGVLERRVLDELPSEGVLAGAIQVPSSGAPVLFLADHPVTGGYPVVAVVVTADLARLAQAAPGDTIRFRAVPGPRLGAEAP